MSIKQLQTWAHPRRILLATDLTDLEYTLKASIRQARVHHAELLIAHVLPGPGHALIDPALLVYSDPERMRELAQAALDQAVAVATSEGVQCSSRLVQGDVVDEIANLLIESKSDRLVAGSHGNRKFLLHILGSVAASLFHRIEVPVLAIGPHASPIYDPTKDRMRIVLAAALDHSAKRLAEFALDIAEEHSAVISLVHVIPEIAQIHPSAAQVTVCSEKMLKGLIGRKKLRKCAVACEVVQGQPVEAIVEYAREHSANLIILGASAHAAFNDRFIPGTAYRVLCKSPCPVLVLKHESAWNNVIEEAKRDRSFHVV